MIKINTLLIKKLREETGAGIIDCKKSLEEVEGNYQKALDIVEKKGWQKALKKQDRIVKCGFIGFYVHSNGLIAGLAELLCETDFVAKNQEFKVLANEIAMQVVAMSPKDNTELLKQESIKNPDSTIEKKVQTLSGKIGEKIKIGRFYRLQIGIDC